MICWDLILYTYMNIYEGLTEFKSKFWFPHKVQEAIPEEKIIHPLKEFAEKDFHDYKRGLDVILEYLSNRIPLSPDQLTLLLSQFDALNNHSQTIRQLIAENKHSGVQLDIKTDHPRIHLSATRSSKENKITLDRQEKNISTRTIFYNTEDEYLSNKPYVTIDDVVASVPGEEETTSITLSHEETEESAGIMHTIAINRKISGDLGYSYGTITESAIITSNSSGEISTVYTDSLTQDVSKMHYKVE